jgi:hypothetical protein
MRAAVTLVVALFLVLACSSLQPVAINTGDVCEGCRKPITNANVAAEIVGANGLAMKFRTVSCMARFMKQHPSEGSRAYVTDFNSGRFLSVRSAVFVKAEIDENNRERDYVAFGDVGKAVEFGKSQGASPVDWPSVVKQTAAAN